MRFYGISDIGLVRQSNQDCYMITTNEANDTIAMVLDGVGGSKSGDVASNMTARFINDEFIKCPDLKEDKMVLTWIKKTINAANDFIVSMAKSKAQYQGMGTTFVATLFCPAGTYVINVGDSRAYLLNESGLIKITKDHTLVEVLIDQGVIKAEDGFNHPQRNVLINAVGIENKIKIDIFNINERYQKMLLCSDGLHGYISDYLIAKIIKQKKSIQAISNELLAKANEAGGFDNTTIVMIEVLDHD